jgi:hypothetical protein
MDQPGFLIGVGVAAAGRRAEILLSLMLAEHGLQGEQSPRKVHGSSCAFRASFRIELPIDFLGWLEKANKSGLFWWTHKGSNLGPLPCEGNALEKTAMKSAGVCRVRHGLTRFVPWFPGRKRGVITRALGLPYSGARRPTA